MRLHITLLTSLAVSSVSSLAVPREQGLLNAEIQEGPISATWVGVGSTAAAIPDRSVPDTDSTFFDVSVCLSFFVQPNHEEGGR